MSGDTGGAITYGSYMWTKGRASLSRLGSTGFSFRHLGGGCLEDENNAQHETKWSDKDLSIAQL